MAITYAWDVVEMACAPELDDRVNVVTSVKWTATATEGGKSTSVCGNQMIHFNDDRPFVPYENLTKTQVLTWVKNDLGADGVALTQQNLAAALASIGNPAVVVPALPWSV
jgi:hypothetical protein